MGGYVWPLGCGSVQKELYTKEDAERVMVRHYASALADALVQSLRAEQKSRTDHETTGEGQPR